MNTAGTYRLDGATLAVDTGGTPVELQIAASECSIEVTNNYADHDRTGGGPPRKKIIDATWEMTLKYAHGFGTDGIFTVFDGLAGTEVDWLLETSDGVVSATFPTIAFTADVPWLSPLPSTAWGEFAFGEIMIPLIGEPAVAVA